MTNDYICDDRNMLEDTQKIRAMSDEEFEAYNVALKEKEKATDHG